MAGRYIILFFLRLPIKFMSFIGVDVVIYLFANYR